MTTVIKNETDNTVEQDLYSEETGMTSIVSYPDRCSLWGNSRFRGNCDGRLFKNLVLRYRAKRVADPMMGSGTTRDVIAGLNRHGHNIHFWGGDLRDGFDLRTDPLPGPFDLVWVHPPYWNMIRYNDGHPRDLSSCESYRGYRYALRRCLCRCSGALRPGGRLAVLVGDLRRNGEYVPIVRDVLTWQRFLGELRSVIIKAQHHCRSDAKRYSRMEDPPIKHEYCVVFKKTVAGNTHPELKQPVMEDRI